MLLVHLHQNIYTYVTSEMTYAAAIYGNGIAAKKENRSGNRFANYQILASGSMKKQIELGIQPRPSIHSVSGLNLQ
jgi:hypothetical protein